MTVPHADTAYRYQGNGVTTVFAYSNRLLTTADVQVQILTRATDAVVETLALTTDYTVTIVSNSLANITITNAAKIPSVTQDLLLTLNLDITQTRSFPRADSLPAADIELGFDKLTLIAQTLDDDIGRSLRFPESDTTTDGELPSKADRALTYLAFDANGAPIASASAAGGAPAGAFGATLVATATQAEAITALGGTPTAPFIDSTAIIKGSADATKLLRIEVDGFTTGTTRVMTPPNYDFTPATLTGTETLTNKTITSGTYNGVNLTTGGSASQYLNGTGSYSTVTAGFSAVATQVFTSSGTYTPTSGMKYCIIRAIGGGGGGGGSTAVAGHAGSGGAAGAECWEVASAATIGASQVVTIPAAAAGGNASDGATGGTVTVGALVSATGGLGGKVGNALATAFLGGAGQAATGGDFNGTGAPGGMSISNATTALAYTGYGGSTSLGGGGKSSAGVLSSPGAAGVDGTGGGGAGGMAVTALATTGGAGGKGIVIITEFI